MQKIRRSYTAFVKSQITNTSIQRHNLKSIVVAVSATVASLAVLVDVMGNLALEPLGLRLELLCGLGVQRVIEVNEVSKQRREAHENNLYAARRVPKSSSEFCFKMLRQKTPYSLIFGCRMRVRHFTTGGTLLSSYGTAIVNFPGTCLWSE
ncbi:hypothetical protein L596_009781 [Steinernema carpocapsae]|uniref:Uncharacterized protein n=1 Tax=Steinernema carpocapsae TaxID=34508 RepID=A0A4U5PH61_STECR|nr:hypothetical protein L596_009781 [Steinernema carpocapsae]